MEILEFIKMLKLIDIFYEYFGNYSGSPKQVAHTCK